MRHGPGGTREEVVYEFANVGLVIEIHQDEYRLGGPPKAWHMLTTICDDRDGIFDGVYLQQYNVNLTRDEVLARAREDAGKWLRGEMLKVLMLLKKMDG